MYSLLVVDDEYYVRKRVKNCIEWEKFDFGEIIEAADGEEACKIIKSRRIDVVIADITMPNMDGLQFIQKIKENNAYNRNNIKIIILTGYDYFHYAQTALNLGVNNFLLKPINSDQMLMAVEKLMIEIKKEETQRVQLSAFEKIKRDEKLLYLFMNLFGEDSRESLLNLFNITENESYSMVMTRIYEHRKEKTKDDLLDEFILENVLEELLSLSFYVIKFEDAWKQRGFICRCKDEDKPQLHKIVKEAIGLIRRKRRLPAIAAVSEVFNGRLGSMKKAYMNVNTILFYSKPVEGEKSYVINAEDMKPSEMNIEKYLMMVEECLVKMDMDQMEDTLECIFEDIEKKRCVLETLELIINYIVIKFYAFAEKYMKEQDFVDFKARMKNIQVNLGKDQSVQTIKEDLKMVFLFIAKKIKEKENVSGEQIKIKTMEYINSHYDNQELNLKMIADEIFLNTNYLSTTFKRYHGSSINEYLNQVRLEKAKKLLEETDLSIQQIAERVGYSDQFYFSKKFKRAYALSPLSFRYACQK